MAVAHDKVKYNNDDSILPHFHSFSNFASLAGDIAELLCCGPGALVLNATGAVLGTLNDAGKVFVDGELKVLDELNNLKPTEFFGQGFQAAGQFINTAFGGSRQDDGNNNQGGGLGGLGGGFFR